MRKIALAALLLLLPSHVFAADLTVRYPRPESRTQAAIQEYYTGLLRLALEKTEADYGSFTLRELNIPLLKQDAIQNLVTNAGLDVMWLMTGKEREKVLLPVRIPLLKGALGYRAFIIREKDRDRFASVRSLEDLRGLQAIQGDIWMDTRILQANGLPVKGVRGYDSMFFLLAKGQADYFPRGINEIWKEVEIHGDKGLTVEENLILQYESPIYFFVNRDNTELAGRLEKGLRAAIDDGSFDRYFFNHPLHREPLRKTKLKSRKIFHLSNPDLPAATPVDDKSLWLDPWQVP